MFEVANDNFDLVPEDADTDTAAIAFVAVAIGERLIGAAADVCGTA